MLGVGPVALAGKKDDSKVVERAAAVRFEVLADWVIGIASQSREHMVAGSGSQGGEEVILRKPVGEVESGVRSMPSRPGYGVHPRELQNKTSSSSSSPHQSSTDPN